ncbi:MAG: NUDIX domain-containing protein [Planctomycetes bacterium]|nr:NUDIX domain-containing protein [Verrucomicrobiota bacterium]MBM4023993.1 NUDIX domain-containing protein [Planctomycetota bacterium]
MKSELQIRAEKAAERFGSARKPIVLEFAGVPKAGKTTTLNALQAFLKRCGFRVEVVVERASVCPIRDKKHANFNVWTPCTTLAQILEKTQNPPRPEDPHILILDRGLFDSICWLTLMERLERIRPQDRQLIEKFLRIDDWRKRISAVFVMTVSPTDSMTREKGLLPVEGGKGSIMNPDVLNQMLNTTKEAAERMKNDFRIFNIDTSSGQAKDGAKKTAEIVADLALNVIEEHLREDILSLPKAEVTKLFGAKRCLPIAEATALVAAFNKTGNFAPREQVEADKSRVQALPVVVIRNKSGDVLRLRRKERYDDNPLHEKLVIWAGGHVRKEDQINGDCLIQCALREVQEELRLSIDAHELSLQGAIYSELGERSAQHVAIVYEWKAATDDIAVVLSSAEFFERRGTSLSGSFVPLKDLALDVDKEKEKERKVTEEWSVEIVREILAKDIHTFAPRLL